MFKRTGYSFVKETEDTYVAESLYDEHQVTVHKDNIRKPKRNSPSELLKAGVLLDISEAGVKMTCMFCGEDWQPLLRRGGYFYRGGWKCFHGCHDNL